MRDFFCTFAALLNRNIMNLYTQKKRWKWLLFVSAFIVFLVILYYSNVLLGEIAREERQKVSLWAEAVTQKAQLVNYTNHFFDEVKAEEAKRQEEKSRQAMTTAFREYCAASLDIWQHGYIKQRFIQPDIVLTDEFLFIYTFPHI